MKIKMLKDTLVAENGIKVNMCKADSIQDFKTDVAMNLVNAKLAVAFLEEKNSGAAPENKKVEVKKEETKVVDKEVKKKKDK